MEAEAHDWVLPVMSAHLQAEKNKTLGKEGPDDFLVTWCFSAFHMCIRVSSCVRWPQYILLSNP